jgi:ribosomal protein S18 acetylase RimI-like enzyme
MTIQPVSEYDAPEILELIQKYFPYLEINFDLFVKRIHHPQFFLQKSMERDRLAGFSEWQIIDLKNKIVRLNGIAVKPPFQRRGYATALLKKGEEWVETQKMKKIILLVAETNIAAKKMYQKNGYSFSRINLKKINGEIAEIWEKRLK